MKFYTVYLHAYRVSFSHSGVIGQYLCGIQMRDPKRGMHSEFWPIRNSVDRNYFGNCNSHHFTSQSFMLHSWVIASQRRHPEEQKMLHFNQFSSTDIS